MIVTNPDTRNYLAVRASHWLGSLEEAAPDYPLIHRRPDGTVMVFSDPATGLIGEMHGCSANYVNGKKKCARCRRLHEEILTLVGIDADPDTATAKRNLNRCLDSVVKHFKNSHPGNVRMTVGRPA